MIVERLKARFEKEEQRKANMRLVYGYRISDTMEMADNMVVLPYNEFDVNKRWLEHCVSEMSSELVERMKGYEVVRLGVWYKDRNKFDFLRVPDFQFRICDVLERKEKRK